MIKITGSLILIFACFLFGGKKVEGMRRKKSFFSEMENAVIAVKRDTTSRGVSLHDAFLCVKTADESVNGLFKKAAEILEKTWNTTEAIRTAFYESENCLDKYEKDTIANIMCSLGKSDAQNEKKIYDLILEEIKKLKNDAEVICREKSRITMSISLMAGGILVVLLW